MIEKYVVQFLLEIDLETPAYGYAMDAVNITVDGDEIDPPLLVDALEHTISDMKTQLRRNGGKFDDC